VVTKVKKRLYTADGKPFRKNGKDLYGEGIAARGQLHEETVFGLHEDKKGNQLYHRRVGVENITNQKQLDHVVDPFLRELILQRVREELPEQFEGTKQNWKISPKQINQVYFYKDDQGILHSKIQLPNAKGEPIPVKKVRIKERISKALKLKRGINQYVKTGGNYCCIVYRKPDETIDFEILTFKEAVSRILEGQRIFQIPEGGAAILNTFVENDLYVLNLSVEEFEYALRYDHAKLSNHLYRVQQMTPSGYKVQLRHHLAGTVTDKRDWAGFASGKSYLELNPRPVRVLTDGRIIALGDD
jgi:CRISPR-associated endonuclease Csn1